MTLALVAVGIAALVIFHQLRAVAFPEHRILRTVTPEQAASLSAAYLHESLGIDVGGVTPSTTWEENGDMLAYLDQTYGVDRATTLASTVPLWGFKTTYYLPGQQEQLGIMVGPDGQVLSYQRGIAAEAPGASLDRAAALGIAERARDRLAPTVGSWRLVKGKATERPARRDWDFTWQRTDAPLPSTQADGKKVAKVQLVVRVHGDRAEWAYWNLKLPNRWWSQYQQRRALNERVTEAAQRYGGWPLAALALAVCAWALVRRELQWRIPLTLAALAAVTAVVVVANSAGNRGAFALLRVDPGLVGGSIADTILSTALGPILQILLSGLAGEVLYRRRFPRHLSLAASFSPRGLMTRSAAIALGIGALVGALDGAYQNLFYIVGTRIGLWVPPTTGFGSAFGLVVPWLQPLDEAFLPASVEELSYRLFAIPALSLLLARILGRERLSLWLAIVLSAFAWGFTHLAHPAGPIFDRAIEVGLVGLVYGWLLVRFGILAPLAAHFTFNSLTTGYDLGIAGSPWAVVLVYGIAAVPLAVAALAVIRARLRGGFADDAGQLNEDLTSRLAARQGHGQGGPSWGRRAVRALASVRPAAPARMPFAPDGSLAACLSWFR